MVYIGQFTGMAVAGTELEWGDILVIIGYFVVVIAVGIAVSIHTHIPCLYDVFCTLNHRSMYIQMYIVIYFTKILFTIFLLQSMFD